MQKLLFLTFILLIGLHSKAQKMETVYLDPKDTNVNKYIAIIPDGIPVKAFMFLLSGLGSSPLDDLQQTDLPLYAAKHGILTILPVLKTGVLYFGIDQASQQSLSNQISQVSNKFNLSGKDFYIGGFSIGGSCAIKYAELASKNKSSIKPKAVFGVDPPLDFEHYYYSAKRILRLSVHSKVMEEIPYMIDRIEKEMHGTPATTLENFYTLSPYSYSDTTQRAIKTLIGTPIMLITEPDIQWWLAQRGYDYSFMNVYDHAAMINELQRLGNRRAVLITTNNKGYRNSGNERHPHSWSIVDKENLINWLISQK
jgi:hypothetical protein